MMPRMATTVFDVICLVTSDRLQGSASIVIQQISYCMAPRAHMPNTGTVVT